MPLFRVENAAASTGGVFLLPFPDVDWFKWAILGAVAEMSNKNNWVGSSTEEIDYAVREANTMLANFKVLGFNPFPVGMVTPFAGTVAPDGYLICDGSTLTVAAYPELFEAIGYQFGGSGDDYVLPNLLGRVVVGSTSGFAIGASGGEASHTLSEAEIPSHSHTIPTTVSSLALEPGEVVVLTPIPIIPSYTGDTGGNGAHNNLQPYQALNYIIYAGRL